MALIALLLFMLLSLHTVTGYTLLSEEKLITISNLTSPEDKFQEFLTPLLVKRVPGTETHAEVQRSIITHFKNLGWHVEEDNFTDYTPLGAKDFSNIIVTKDINANKRLVLTAHYDSKYFPPPDDNFIGATDSAFPCALLLDLAYTLNPLLNNKSSSETTLQFVFFDGEEAFKSWSDIDSLYGSRHLATKWETTYVTRTDYFQHQATSLLDGIELFVLLDLLGAKNPKIMNYYQVTSWSYNNLAQIENRLWKQKLLKGDENDLDVELYFDKDSINAFQSHIEDDHMPFLKKGVPILHIISYPFPEVWHTLGDNRDALNADVMYNWNLIIRIFVAEYLNL